MLNTNSGTFRIRSTGKSRGVKRSIVATFRRTSFLDYLYFTDFETSDPLTYTNATDRTNAATQCMKYRSARAAVVLQRTSRSRTSTRSRARCTRTTTC